MSGADLITAERQRQIDVEGWTPEHDDHHSDGQLAWAAVCYAAPDRVYRLFEFAKAVQFSDPWPAGWRSPRFDGNVPRAARTAAEQLDWLIKAGALIAAEIDRLQRVES